MKETEPASDGISTGDARAISDVGENPRITDTLATPPPAAAGGLVDRLGVAFNPALHESSATGPRMRADGGWCLKRGNGARKVNGKSPAGGVAYVVPPPGKQQEPPAAGAAPGPAPAPNQPPPVNGEQILETTLENNPVLGEADYEGTAIGLQNGIFSLARLTMGPAWQEDNDERDAWRGCIRRLWHHYQLPRVGPILEMLMLGCATIAKRREDARTLQGWAKMKAWMGLGAPVIESSAEKENKAA